MPPNDPAAYLGENQAIPLGPQGFKLHPGGRKFDDFLASLIGGPQSPQGPDDPESVDVAGPPIDSRQIGLRPGTPPVLGVNTGEVARGADSDTSAIMDLLGDKSDIQVEELPPVDVAGPPIPNPVEEVINAAPLPAGAGPMINIGQKDDVSRAQAEQDLTLRAMIEQNAANTTPGRTEIASPVALPSVIESDANIDPQVQALVDQDQGLDIPPVGPISPQIEPQAPLVGRDTDLDPRKWSSELPIQPLPTAALSRSLDVPLPPLAANVSPEPISPQVAPQVPVAPPPLPPQAPRQDVVVNEADRILEDNPQLFGMQGDELAFALQDLGVDEDVLLYIHELVTDQFQSVDIGDNIQ